MLVSDTRKRLTELMVERNLRQSDVVKMCLKYKDEYGITVSKNSICQYLSGKSVPAQKKLFILSKALDVDPAWLMGADVTRDGKKPEEDPDVMKEELMKLFVKMDMREKVDLLSYAYDILEKRKG